MPQHQSPRRVPSPKGGTWPVRFGTAELVRDLDRPAGWMLLVDSTPQSYLDLADPEHLEFDYVRLLADVVDAGSRPGLPLSVVHLGGGACTLARWVAARRPGSTQIVVEADDLLAEVIRAQFGTDGFRLRVGDGRAALSHLQPAASDLVVGDVFVGAQVPSHMATIEHVRQVAGLLKPTGAYVVNLADSGALGYLRQQVATMQAVFSDVVLLGEPGVLRGRRFGNVVLAGSQLPPELELLRRWTAGAMGRARVVAGTDLVDFAAGTRPATDAEPPVAPTPPPGLFR